MSKKVSIIIPCYNQANYIKDSINSAINQTYNNIEIIIINDGSTDNSSEIIESFANKYKQITFINNKENKGVIFCRNYSISLAQGEYILPLDGDDTIERTYIEKAVKILENNPEIGFVYCKAKKFGIKNRTWKLPKFNKTEFLISNCIFCSALFRKSDFERVGKYNANMTYGLEDWDLWLSFIQSDLKPYRINETLFNYRQYKNKTRSNICNKYSEQMFNNIIYNHKNLYLENFTNIIQFLKKKSNKYKILFNITLSLLIIETMILLLQLIIKSSIY